MPTPKQVQINTLQNIAGVLYVSVLLFCIVYLVYSVVMDIKEWRLEKKLRKYYEENPIDWILDFQESQHYIDRLQPKQ